MESSGGVTPKKYKRPAYSQFTHKRRKRKKKSEEEGTLCVYVAIVEPPFSVSLISTHRYNVLFYLRPLVC